ncbi:hypothetical protein M9H77_26062 [Catharanthus roseus]|uniref:Uncharacterized protein n=1 Tax=Catharanthus roseus TaxID=4058 RepID=A0ACC0AAQ4_CATRO|nr:hypothetical protein M9H77_26062 [Catharanthus roseus]
MVKLTRSLTIGFVETTFVDTTLIDITPTLDVWAETLPPPTDQALTERPPATPKVPEYVIDDTQSGNSNRFYDSSCVKKFDLLLIDHGLLELLVNSKLLNSTRFAKRYNEFLVHKFYANMDESIVDDNSSFFGVVYVRGEVIDFNVEELSAFFIPTHSDVEGLVLKDDIDLDMVTAELTRGKPVNMGQRYIMFTENNFKNFNRASLLSKVMSYNSKLRLLLSTLHKSDFVIV